MKKLLTLFITLICVTGLFAQNKDLKMSGVKRIEFKKTVSEPTGALEVKVEKPKHGTNSVKSVFKVYIGESANPYCVKESRSTCLTATPGINLINFTARTNEPSPVLGNNVAAYFSTNGGNSFNTTLMRPWTSPNDYFARYPSGVIYNPAGNTDPSGAFIAVSGPTTYLTNWNGSYYASQKFDGSLRNEQFTLYETDTAGGTGFLNQQPVLYMQNRKNKVFVLGDSNTDDGVGFTSISGVVNFGQFQGSSISWSRQIVTPNYATNNDGYLAGNGQGALVMDDNGNSGYLVFVGRNNNASDNFTYQPIIFKTNDGGQTWNEEAFNWTDIPAIQNEANNLSPVDRPFFSNVLDITMDMNGKVHFAAFVHGAYSNNPDSLEYQVTYSLFKGFVYDIHQTSSGWDAFLVDTIWASDAVDYPFISFTNTERFQMSRTTDGSKIIYAWCDTDPTLDFINRFPDIYVKLYNVSSNVLLPKQNITRNTELDATCFGMYLSDYSFQSGNGICTIPISVTEHGAADTNPVTHYFVSGVNINSSTGAISNLSGRVFHDDNENGTFDNGEQGAAGHRIKFEPGPLYTYSDNNGYYHFLSDTGNITITCMPTSYWHTTTPASYFLNIDSVNQIVDTLDFGVKSSIDVNDVSVFLTGMPTRPGFLTQYFLTYRNFGTLSASGTIEFTYDSTLNYISSIVSPITHAGNVLVYQYDTLDPGEIRYIRIDFQVPGVQFLGDTLHSSVIINPVFPDSFITNNYDTLVQVITGSFDPNDKSVSPSGYEQWGFVEHGQRLTYTIRFQNTGTDTAFNISIRDTLNPNLDPGTILFESWSHNFSWEINNSNEVLLTFSNILLPDSNTSEPESHGFVRYSVSPYSGLNEGTEVTNTAYIFFDYNPAVVTNTTINTFVTNIPLSNNVNWIMESALFPNPTSEKIIFDLHENVASIDIYNSNGSIVKQILAAGQISEIDVSDLPEGLYIIKISSGKMLKFSIFIKE